MMSWTNLCHKSDVPVYDLYKKKAGYKVFCLKNDFANFICAGAYTLTTICNLWRWCCISITLMSHPCLASLLSHVFLFLTQDWNKCYVGCEFGFSASKIPDATFGIAPDPSVDGILRSMESSQYYSENNIDVARGWVRTNLFWLVFSMISLPFWNDFLNLVHIT